MLSQLLALSSFILAGGASECDVDPIRVPIQNTQVLEDVDGSNMVGMRVTVGSPAQTIVMLPWAFVHSFPNVFRTLIGIALVQVRSSADAFVLPGKSIIP